MMVSKSHYVGLREDLRAGLYHCESEIVQLLHPETYIEG